MDYSQWADALRGSLNELGQYLSGYLPSLLGALVLVLGGWTLARLFRGLIRRLAGRFDWLLGSQLVAKTMQRLGIERSASEVVGALVFWAVLLLFITAATEALGLPVIATWIGGLSYYLPRVLVGLLIVLAGLLAGNVAGEVTQRAATAAGLSQAPLLGRAAQLGIVLIAVVTAVEQLGINTDFLTTTITIVLAAVIGGAALAFALGARTHVRNLIAAHYLRQVYRSGQTVRVAGVEGRLAEILTTAVVIDASEGQVMVPAGEFAEALSVRVTSEA